MHTIAEGLPLFRGRNSAATPPVGPPLRVGMYPEVTCGRVGGEEVGGAGLVSLLVHLRPVSELGLGFRVRVRV